MQRILFKKEFKHSSIKKGVKKMLFKFNFIGKTKLAILVVMALIVQMIAPLSISFAGDNDITAYGYNISNNSGWTPGNLGSTYEEGEWVAFQTIITNVNWNVMDRVGVAFDFYDSGRFYDLVRNISVSNTQLPNNKAFPKSDGGAYPLTTPAEINNAQREPNEYFFTGFTPIDFSNAERQAQINIGTNRFDETRIFYITEEQVIEAGLGNSSTLVIYFQLHLSRTFMWNNLGMFDTDNDGIKDTELPLAYAYSDPSSPTYNWGGYAYDEAFLTSGSAPYTMLGSASYPGSSGHSYVYTQPGSGAKTIPIPDIGETTGMISGYKFNDLNGNGVWDKPTEPALNNWEIFLRTDLYAIEDLEWSVNTDPNGYFQFTNLPYNLIYELTEELQTNYSQTSPYSGILGAGTYNPGGNVETTWWKVAQELNFQDRADWGWSVKLAPGNLSQTNVNFGNRQAGYLKITKSWTGYPQGYQLPVSVTGTITGPNNYSQPFTITANELPNAWEKTFGPLVPGQYTVTEDDVPGWTTTRNPSNGLISVTAGAEAQAVSVSIENTLDKGYLRITKEWLGYPDDYQLPASITGTITGPFGYSEDFEITANDNWEKTFGPLVPGQYDVDEDPITGWSTEYDPENGIIQVTAGTEIQAVSVSIENTLDVGSLTVNKVIANPEMIPDGYILPPFEITISGMGYTDTQTIADGDSYTWDDLVPGNYTVTEGLLGIEWQVSITNGGSATVVAGEDTDVTVTNTYVPQYHDETMWAYYEGSAITFKEVAGYLKNWGWTNGPFGVEPGDSIELDLYAGAGGNDISNGQLVGTVFVEFNMDDSITVTYDTGDHDILDIHFFIGNDMLPKVNKNKYTNSPGQFPFDDSYGDYDSDNRFSMTLTPEDLMDIDFTKDIYISAHGVVRIYE